MLDDIAELKERWIELCSKFSAIREKLLSSVVQWEWANGPRYDPRPFYFQRGYMRDISRERLLRRIPAVSERYGLWSYGYDSEERLVVSSEDDGNWATFNLIADNYSESIRYQASCHIIRGVSRLYFRDGQPIQYIGFSLSGKNEDFSGEVNEVWQNVLYGKLFIQIEREDYLYTVTLLTAIKRSGWRHNSPYDKGDISWDEELHLDYKMLGVLNRITSGNPDSKDMRIEYQRRLPGETLQFMTDRVQSLLIEAIPKVIERADFSEPLYCLQLQYKDYGNFFPPMLMPGFESRRQRIMQTIEHPRYYRHNEIWAVVWDADDDTIYPPYQIEDAETLMACERLQREIPVKGNIARFRQAIRMLRKIARTLNELDWSKYAPVTSDFIVYTMDQENIAMALRLSGATREQIADWRKRGML